MLMFYVSDIDGQQTPFVSELFRQMRIDRLREEQRQQENLIVILEQG